MEGYQGIRAKLYDAREDALKTKNDIEFYIQEVQNAGEPSFGTRMWDRASADPNG